MCCGEIEVGRCDICGEVKPLRRKYYHYDIKCDCHSPKHFEIVMHCNNCEPRPPYQTKVNYLLATLKPID